MSSMQLIESFNVDRFRGLDHLVLDGLNQVNLIVGGNNSGKTSVLEALAVYASPTDVGEWAQVARMREVRSSLFRDPGLSSTDALRWLFPQRDVDDLERDTRRLTLAAQGRIRVRSISAECLPIHGIPPEPRYSTAQRRPDVEAVEQDGWQLAVDIVTDPGAWDAHNLRGPMVAAQVTADDQRLRLEVDLWSTTGLRYAPIRSFPTVRSVMLSPYSHRNQPMQLSMLSRLIASGQKPDLIELLRGVDQGIADLEILTESSGRPLITALFANKRRVPVSVLGDGFRRALSIGIAMNQAKGGFLLIDEVETALHVSALDDLFPWLMRLAEQQSVQVFATTHSLEAIQAITNAAARSGGDRLTAYQLPSRAVTREGARRYSTGMLERIVRDRGLDIR